MRIDGEITRGPVRFTVDDAAASGWAGETVAAAMLAGGIARFRDDRGGRPRGLFCNMGTCGECLVDVVLADGRRRRVRACLQPIEEGLAVVTAGARLP